MVNITDGPDVACRPVVEQYLLYYSPAIDLTYLLFDEKK